MLQHHRSSLVGCNTHAKDASHRGFSIGLKPAIATKATHYFSTQGFIDAICSALFPFAPAPPSLPPEGAELRCGCRNILASGLDAGPEPEGADSVVAMIVTFERCDACRSWASVSWQAQSIVAERSISFLVLSRRLSKHTMPCEQHPTLLYGRKCSWRRVERKSGARREKIGLNWGGLRVG